MRIPLDYYRILGIPIQATETQLSQAYHDRSLQLPRREYSSSAITARKQLLERAVQVLADSEQRAEYDQNLLEKTDSQQPDSTVSLPFGNSSETETSEDSSQTPQLDIPPEHFVGALLILQELGEYEIVIRLGKAYLDGKANNGFRAQSLEKIQQVRADVILTLALAYLELGREYWQQQKYEKAADAVETGKELLEREGLFTSVQAEIQGELAKLRPYRILGLLALDESQVKERQQGLQLLQQMLQQRQGIDGKGDDKSGLSTDDFLRFIQQLRGYLTTTEQQELFQAEARRPSVVASYLAVYALLARGFAYKEPSLIVQAQKILKQLGKRQDVNLERAVCALLLGQTEETSLALERSQEKETLAFIREHSQDSPDLLPGLCLYAENWLQTEVFSQFRDLAKRKASLQEYFADEEVQAYLEQLPNQTTSESERLKVTPKSQTVTPIQSKTRRQNSDSARRQQAVSLEPVQAVGSNYVYGRSQNHGPGALVGKMAGASSDSATLAAPATVHHYPTSGVLALKDVETVPRGKTGQKSRTGKPRRGRSRQSTPQHLPQKQQLRKSALTSPLPSKTQPSPKRKRFLSHSLPKGGILAKIPDQTKRLLLLGMALVLGVGIVGLLIKELRGSRPSSSLLEGEQLLIQLSQPPIAIPAVDAHLIVADKVLTEESAKHIIENWLSAKSKAFGSEHQVEQLNQALAPSILSGWRKSAEVLKNGNGYREYQHQIAVRSVQMNPDYPDKATVEAGIREITKNYQGGQLKQSSDDNLIIRYNLVRQNQQWLIEKINVVQ